jgi:hypothetical protein
MAQSVTDSAVNDGAHATDPSPARDPSTLADLVPDPTNRRLHPARNVAMIAASVREVGAARSIVIDEDGEVLAGNGLVRGAQDAGLTKLHVVDVDGETVVAVRRRGLTPAQKRALALYDNRTAELAEWNAPQLTIDLQTGQPLAPFFTPKELRKFTMTPSPDVADQTVPGSHLVVITCTDEAQQVALLDRFLAEGLSCKALVS